MAAGAPPAALFNYPPFWAVPVHLMVMRPPQKGKRKFRSWCYSPLSAVLPPYSFDVLRICRWSIHRDPDAVHVCRWSVHRTIPMPSASVGGPSTVQSRYHLRLSAVRPPYSRRPLPSYNISFHKHWVSLSVNPVPDKTPSLILIYYINISSSNNHSSNDGESVTI
jgi:hypothetical protein